MRSSVPFEMKNRGKGAAHRGSENILRGLLENRRTKKRKEKTSSHQNAKEVEREREREGGIEEAVEERWINTLFELCKRGAWVKANKLCVCERGRGWQRERGGRRCRGRGRERVMAGETEGIYSLIYVRKSIDQSVEENGEGKAQGCWVASPRSCSDCGPVDEAALLELAQPLTPPHSLHCPIHLFPLLWT